MSANHPPPVLYQLTAGAVAGISEILIMYPLDVVKTRIQLQSGKGTGIGAYRGTFDCFQKIVRNEGFSLLYRGISAPILMEAPKRATKFAANDSCGKFYLELFGIPAMDQKCALLTGATAGAIESFVVVPFELVKIRLQDRAQRHRYKGVVDCVIKVARTEGLLTFYQGLESTIWRHIVWNAGYFGSIFKVRDSLPVTTTTGERMRNDLLAGSIGGTVGTILNTPIDVVKSRIQNTAKADGVIRKYNWAWPSLVTIAREEGFAALYKGFIPKVLRFCPGGGILLVVYSRTLDFMVPLEKL